MLIFHTFINTNHDAINDKTNTRKEQTNWLQKNKKKNKIKSI